MAKQPKTGYIKVLVKVLFGKVVNMYMYTRYSIIHTAVRIRPAHREAGHSEALTVSERCPIPQHLQTSAEKQHVHVYKSVARVRYYMYIV